MPTPNTEKTTDFEQFLWAEYVTPREHEDFYELYSAVEDDSEVGMYRVEKASNGARLVRGNKMTLVLASDVAKAAFLHHMFTMISDEFDHIEQFIAFKRAMANEHA